MQARTAVRIGALALAAIAYVAASHWLMTQTQASSWNVVIVLMPMLLALGVGSWRSGQRLMGGIAFLVLLVLCVQAGLGVKVPAHVLYLGQHVGFNLFLAVFFGSTLRAGHTALITTLATRVHGGHLVPAMSVYTRNVTRAWAIFFVVTVLISLALFFTASFEAWAIFANWVSPISVVLMFGGEHLLRYRLHPEFERSTVAQAIRAYMQGSKTPAQSDSAS
ncbi:MAG: hypothetical protein H7Y33_08925 [Cytophagales bacterium]|nr:hypothetical protein [Rhizobacter sp.]